MKMTLPDRFVLFIVPLLGWLVIRLLGGTWRFTTIGLDQTEVARKDGGPVIYALWHGRMLPLVYSYRGRSICALVSQHRDGELAARIVHRLGYATVRGSSTRGGARGFQQLLKEMTAGSDAALMPDGPRGPVRTVQPGVLRLAQLSGCTIVPVTAGASHAYRLKSWDRFLIPKPFARCVIICGPPLTVPRDAGQDILDAGQGELEQSLNRITDEADAFFG